MKHLKIFKYIFVLLLVSAPSLTSAQTNAEKTTRIRGVQFAEKEDSATIAEKAKKIPLFAGVAISVDAAGAVMAGFTPYGTYEAACRISIKDRYFPIFEFGIGSSDHTEESTQIHYKTHSPFYRIGADYNFTKDRFSFGRIYGGLRYAFTSFKYDVSGPDIQEPFWDGSVPFQYGNVKSNAHWAEAVFGLDAKIWKFFRLGWSIRYKMKIKEKKNDIGKAWYIPGYGKSDSHALGGTFNLIFEL